jgi:hypothetical protein
MMMFTPLAMAYGFIGTWVPVKHNMGSSELPPPTFIMNQNTITMQTPISTIQCQYMDDGDGHFVCHTFSIPKMPNRFNMNLRHVQRYYNIVKNGLYFNVTSIENDSIVFVSWKSGQTSGKLTLRRNNDV